MTNYQKCTKQWENLQELLPQLNETVKKCKKCDQILAQMNSVTGTELTELTEKLGELVSEVLFENQYYQKRLHDLDGIKISKGQISFEEFEALLYFAMITNADRTQWFENFGEMYRWITYGFDKCVTATY